MTVPPPPIDRLSGLLERFPVRAELSFTGTLCGVQSFTPPPGMGYLHLLRRGTLDVTHPPRQAVPLRLHLSAPALLFYPRAIAHHFHNPPIEGADFTCAQLWFEGGPAHPLVRTLPGAIVLSLDEVEGLGASLELLFAETARVRCGHRISRKGLAHGDERNARRIASGGPRGRGDASRHRLQASLDAVCGIPHDRQQRRLDTCLF